MDSVDRTEEPENLSAEEAFVHGLLASQSQDGGTQKSTRLTRAMTAIDDAAMPELLLRQAPSRRGPLIITAAAMLILSLVLFLERPMPLPEALQQAVERIAEGDRHYRFQVFAAGEREPRIEGQLDLRDADHALLRFGDQTQPLVLGRADGVDWFGPRIESTQAERPWLQPDDQNILDLVHHLLAQLPGHYRVDNENQHKLHQHLSYLAHKRKGPTSLPDQVHVKLDPKTLTVRSLEAKHREPEGSSSWLEALHTWFRELHGLPPEPQGKASSPYRILLELQSQAPFPEGWFERETHVPG